MKKTYSFLLTLLCSIGGLTANAQSLTSNADITQGTVYTIVAADAARGALNTSDLTGNAAHASNELSTCGATHGGVYAEFASVAVNSSNPYQQYTFIQYDGNYYLYNLGTRSFVYANGNRGYFGNSTLQPVNLIAATHANFSGKAQLTFNTGSGTRYLTFSNNESGKHAIYMQTGVAADINDGGAALTIAAVSGTTLSAVEEAYAKSFLVLQQAQALLSLSTESQVGYPNAAARNELNTAISTVFAGQVEGSVSPASLLALETAMTTYKTTTDINLPVDGKAYRIYSCSPNGEERLLYCTGSQVTGNVSTSAISGYQEDNTIWICHKTSDSDPSKCLFVNHQGVYLNWFCDEASKGLNTTGCADTYTEPYHVWTMERATTDKTGGTISPVPTVDQLFGRFQLKGNGKNNKTYYLIARNNAAGTNNGVTTFHAGNANDKYYMSENQNTYIFKLEEVPYYNTVKFQTPATADGNDYATVCLPFAYTVPAGATAYTATTGDGTMSLKAVEGGVIAKGQAVIMMAPTSANLGTVDVAPATTAGTTNDDNELQGTVAETATSNSATSQTYVLNGSFGQIGFYPYNATNLPKGRAYVVKSTSTSPALLFHFGDEETGIGSIETGKTTEGAYFDLSGRRVMHPVKGSLYICNGKKVIR